VSSFKAIVFTMLWTVGALVASSIAMFVFTFGDCSLGDSRCVAFQNGAMRMIPILAAFVYGIGIGVIFQRWLISRR
jgi:hypothetical protein